MVSSGDVWSGVAGQGKVRMRNTYFTIEGIGRFLWYRRMPVNEWRVLRQYVYARDAGRCRYCDVQVELFKCHIHHVQPLEEGGTNHPTNLKVLCVPCHKKRHPFMLTPLDRLP